MSVASIAEHPTAPFPLFPASANLKQWPALQKQCDYFSESASTVFRTHSWHFRHFIVTLTHAIDVPSMLLSSASF
jgi:hypothetical protein